MDKVYTMNIETGEGWAETLDKDLIRGCIFGNPGIFLMAWEKVCTFFQHTNPSDLFVFGGMFLLPDPPDSVWISNGDFRGWIGGI